MLLLALRLGEVYRMLIARVDKKTLENLKRTLALGSPVYYLNR